MKLAILFALPLLAGPALAQRGTARGATPPAARGAQPVKAPAEFTARFETSKGPFTVKFVRDSAPLGVDRAYELIRAGFYDDARFYRVIGGFVAQFGITGNATLGRRYERATIADDPKRGSNKRGTMTFALNGPKTRTTQLFVNLKDNAVPLDTMGFVPIGEVIDGMAVLDSLYSGYDERSAGFLTLGWGDSVGASRNKYFDRAFPRLDRIIKVTILP